MRTIAREKSFVKIGAIEFFIYAIMPHVQFDLRRIAPSRDADTWLYPALVLLLSVFAIAPLTYPGTFQTHTGLLAVYNLMDLHAQLASITNWSATFGRAFDLFRMDGSLGYYAAEIFYLGGLAALDSIKIVYALAFITSGLGMFVLARRIFESPAAGLLASVVYIYFPYHLAVVYIRGAFGEALAWGLFPFALLALIWLQELAKPSLRDYFPSVILFALLALAQLGLAILFGIFTRIWFLVLGPKIPRERGLILSRSFNAAFGGVLLGIALMYPAIARNGAAVAAEGFTPAFVYPFQLLTASWGSAPPTGSYLDQFPYQLGIGALGLTLLAVALLARNRETNPSRDVLSNVPTEPRGRSVVVFAICASIILLALITPFAAGIWDFIGPVALVQFPFQLVAFVALLLSLAAASVTVSDLQFAQRQTWSQPPMLAALVAIPTLAVYGYLAPEFIDFSPTHPPLARFNQNELALLDAKITRPPEFCGTGRPWNWICNGKHCGRSTTITPSLCTWWMLMAKCGAAKTASHRAARCRPFNGQWGASFWIRTRCRLI